MIINELYGKIRTCEDRIGDCDNQIRKCTAQIQELEELEYSLMKAIQNLDAYQEYRSKKRNSTTLVTGRPQLMMDYYGDMGDVLVGKQYQNAAYGLKEAQEITGRKQQVLDDQINELKRNKNNYANEINGYQNTIRILEKEVMLNE